MSFTTNGFMGAFSSLGLTSSPVHNYIYRLDGLTQYYKFSEDIVIPPDVDFSIKFDVLGSNDVFEGLIDSLDGSFWLRFLGFSQNNNLQGIIQGSYITEVPFSYAVIRDGLFHSLSVNRVDGIVSINFDGKDFGDTPKTDGFTFNVLGKFSTSEFGGIMKNFEVTINGVQTVLIPLTDKSQGDTQLATIGDVSATIINYTENWEEV